jgi:hypothetical protein
MVLWSLTSQHCLLYIPLCTIYFTQLIVWLTTSSGIVKIVLGICMIFFECGYPSRPLIFLETHETPVTSLLYIQHPMLVFLQSWTTQKSSPSSEKHKWDCRAEDAGTIGKVEREINLREKLSDRWTSKAIKAF